MLLDINLERTIAGVLSYKYVTRDYRTINNILESCSYADGNSEELTDFVRFIECRIFLIGMSLLIQNDILADPYAFINKHSVSMFIEQEEKDV